MHIYTGNLLPSPNLYKSPNVICSGAIGRQWLKWAILNVYRALFPVAFLAVAHGSFIQHLLFIFLFLLALFADRRVRPEPRLR